ncbi:MAG: iron-sulfur cluster assembly accessory protein [Verrucomicrobiia bacterium]
MLTLTPAAIGYLQELVPAADRHRLGLRIFVEKGGCSGLSYGMTVAEPQPNDTQLAFDDTRVFVDADSSRLLAGCEIDYEDSLTSTGFKIRNPNAKQTCGCGTSFEA